MSVDRKLTYYFLELPYKESMRILIWLDLLNDDDSSLKLHEVLPRAVDRAHSRGILCTFKSEVLRVAEQLGKYDPEDPRNQ